MRMLTSRLASLSVVHRARRGGPRGRRCAPPAPRERLLQVGGDIGDLLPGEPVGAGGGDPEDHAADRQQREGEEGDQGQLDVEREHDHDHARRSVRVLENRVDDAVGDQLVERLHVVGHPRDQHPRAAPGEEADRHLLDVGVDALAQVLQRPLADPADEVGLRVGGGPVDRHRGDEDEHDHRQRALVAVLDPAVDRLPGQVRGRQRRGGRHQQRRRSSAITWRR